MNWQSFYLRQGRYVILGSMDGLLAVLGIVLGLSAIADDRVVLAAGLGGAVALALTNGLGSFLAESAVEYGRLARIEDAMLTSLEDTEKETAVQKTILMDSLTHGGFSFIGSLIPLVPYVAFSFWDKTGEAVVYSVAYLFVLGVFSGRISRRNLVVSIVKMVGLGLVVAVVTFALGATHG